MPFKFEKLEIWKLAIEFADEVHLLTRKFPKEEMFSLTSQFKRAADSISLNIAEGSIGQSNPEQKKICRICYPVSCRMCQLSLSFKKKKLYF
jgi:four helix bundle protein